MPCPARSWERPSSSCCSEGLRSSTWTRVTSSASRSSSKTKLHDLLVVGEAAARANNRDVIEPWDLPITKGLREQIHAFRGLEVELELHPILEQLATLPPLDLALGYATEQLLPEIVGAIPMSLACTFSRSSTPRLGGVLMGDPCGPLQAPGFRQSPHLPCPRTGRRAHRGLPPGGLQHRTRLPPTCTACTAPSPSGPGTQKCLAPPSHGPGLPHPGIRGPI